VVLLFGAGSIDAASQCVPFFFRYRRLGQDGIEVRAVPWRGPVCARGLLAYERVFERVVAGATRVELLPGAVRLSGAAGAVTLRRPEGGLAANPFGNQPAQGPQLLWGHFRLVEAGGERPSVAHPIDIALGRMSVEARSGCVVIRWRQDWGPQGSTFASEPWPEAVCERALTGAEQALERIMPQVRTTEWVAPYRVLLSGPAGAVVLERVRAGT
jgi:hypothetical protein